MGLFGPSKGSDGKATPAPAVKRGQRVAAGTARRGGSAVAATSQPPRASRVAPVRGGSRTSTSTR
jgi:hypothetical protein